MPLDPKINLACPYCNAAIYETLNWFKKPYSTCPACDKGLVAGQFAGIISDLEQARQALRFTLSENVTAAIPPGDERIYRLAETLAAQFTPLSPAERESLLASSAKVTPIFSG